ncbi:MAG: type II toxin-antitoxin system HicB family antitoxin [Chloroflexi bacterium]|nr:type II toxin-antitoxin system HicB family antitoxin [Chloroflexota bacterium]
MTDEATIDEAVRVALAAPYTRLLTREEDGGYSTSVLELPGCFSSGDTPEDAMEMLDEAIELWVAVEVEDGHDIPPPTRAVEYSGRLTLRLLPSIHERAALLAQHERVSLNRYLANAISYYVGLGSPQVTSAATARTRTALMAVREEPGQWASDEGDNA